MKNFENFNDHTINMDEVITGGKHLCTSWESADGSTSGDDLYDTETCTIAYF